ncbi:MAG: M48 family metalloprotease [Solirubrobacterales bacterium]
MNAHTESQIQNTFLAPAAILLAGFVADLSLWPRGSFPRVVPVDASNYFSTAVIERAEDFRGLQSWLGVAGLLTLVAVPLAFAVWWPRDRAGQGLSGGWPRRAVLIAGIPAIVALTAFAAALPFQLVAFSRSRDVGLTVQPVGEWLADRALAAVLTSLGVALLASVAVLLVRRLRRAWWPVFWAVLLAFAAAVQLLAPIALAPLFADFRPLPAGSARDDVTALARSADVRPGEILVVDAAGRTNAANAYVGGLGTTKRVVLYDTLLRDFDRRQQRQVIAHELGHAHYGDITRGLVWFAGVSLICLPAIDLIARRLARRRGVEVGAPAFSVMLIAAAMVAVTLSQPAANAYSRAVEARADAFALRVTADPAAGVSLARRLAVRNISRPRPPWLLHALLGTHPTPIERIGMAEALRRR